MLSIQAIYAGGVFRPLEQVTLQENQHVTLTIEGAAAPRAVSWLEAAKEFQRQLIAQHGVFPDSTPEIAADRRRHE